MAKPRSLIACGLTLAMTLTFLAWPVAGVGAEPPAAETAKTSKTPGTSAAKTADAAEKRPGSGASPSISGAPGQGASPATASPTADKTGAKAEGQGSKSDAPASEKSKDKSGDSAATPSEGAKSAKHTKSKRHVTADDFEPETKIGQGPSPASPPPLNMGGLREEIRCEFAPVAIDPGAAPRTKVEQMLAEVTKARQALHDDTIRLEAMMAQDGSESPVAGAAAPGGPAATGRPAAKNPLDVLAKALRGIKPEQAAPIVSRLDKRLAATVLQRMPPVDAGKIMGAMKPDTAAELATQIAMRAPGEAKR